MLAIFALLDPEPDLDFEYASGSTDLIESGSNTDQDPRHCSFPLAPEPSKAENIPGISAASDAYDVFVNLDQNFQNHVVDKLSQTSRNAVIEQQDPSTLTQADRDRIQGEIMQAVFGKFME